MRAETNVIKISWKNEKKNWENAYKRNDHWTFNN